MNTTVYQKGSHLLEVMELGESAKINGFLGWLDSIELMTLLLGNGYKIVR